MKSNQIKQALEALFEEKRKAIEEADIASKLALETIDVTLPGYQMHLGSIHPLQQTIMELEDLYIGMGYTIEEGPEIETDEYCFEKLNLPKGHPARDMQDTFYITPELLLRSQTSPVQVRTMLKERANPLKSFVRVKCIGGMPMMRPIRINSCNWKGWCSDRILRWRI